MTGWYILDDNNNAIPAGIREAGDFKFSEEGANRCRVALTGIREVLISTVFLGLDHNYLPDGPPLLFETLCGYRGNQVITFRYSTWGEAELGHMQVVEYFDENYQLALAKYHKE